ncbi:efflux RND transporter periplasmic adaptor subunit [Flavobacteriaceae bacterium]|nr:efflux RND transporter periplasmic adaptor subunit [Flavobacteriaceae bacterium]
MKKTLLLFTSIFLAQCGSSDKQITAEIIEGGDLAAIQTKKTEVVKTINALQTELNLLNNAIGEVDTQKKFLLVSSVAVNSTSYTHYVDFQGTLETDKNIVVYPEIPGLLKTINVRVGQKVKQGQLMATLSDSGLIDQLEQLELQLELAKTTYNRQSRLWDQKIGSEIQYLQAKTQFKSLEKSIAQMKDQVAKTNLIAPFDGIIDQIMADPGSNLAPGMTPVLRIINMDEMKVSAFIPELHLPNISANTPVVVNIPVLRKSLDAKVSSVGNFINPNNRSFRIEIELKNQEGDLKPNMTAQLRVNDYINPTALMVASKNILEDQAGAHFVYTLEEVSGKESVFKAVKTFVTIGKSSDNQTEILSGLQAGDRLVEDGIRLIEDQQLVNVTQS